VEFSFNKIITSDSVAQVIEERCRTMSLKIDNDGDASSDDNKARSPTVRVSPTVTRRVDGSIAGYAQEVSSRRNRMHVDHIV